MNPIITNNMSQPNIEAELGEAKNEWEAEMQYAPLENWLSFEEWLEEKRS